MIVEDSIWVLPRFSGSGRTVQVTADLGQWLRVRDCFTGELYWVRRRKLLKGVRQ